MVEVRRRQHETVGAMLRRFTRRVQQSGVLLHARRHKSYKTQPTKGAVRKAALRRVAQSKERMRLEKMGKLNSEGRGR